MGRDEGGREGNDEGRAKKDGASADMPRDASDGRVSGLVSIAIYLSFHSAACSQNSIRAMKWT